MPDLAPVRRALLSVSDKTGLVPFARALHEMGVELISTGGTAAALREAGLSVTSVDSITQFPEMLSGRVKTLHPMIHGGLLGLRDDPTHESQMARHGIRPIDLLCVNLYPFERTVAKQGCTPEEAIENIDIGGPAMLRSASKNFEYVLVVPGPHCYERVLHELRTLQGRSSRHLRAELAAETFALTARYDAAIAAYLAPTSTSTFPPLMQMSLARKEELRYGENPHQPAALYVRSPGRAGGVAGAEQLHGKELSYNNLSDAAAAFSLVVDTAAVAAKTPSGPAVSCCVVKHTNPCGACLAATAADAVDEAIAGDPVAAYGGILALSAPLDAPAAERLCRKDVFLEVIIAPSFSPEALTMLRARSANVRLLATGPIDDAGGGEEIEHRSIPGGVLVQARDRRFVGIAEIAHRAGPAPTPAMLASAMFLEVVVRGLFSNAIAIGGSSPARPGAMRLFGAGAGQMDRVTACGLAVGKAGELARGAVAFSDAFFPFSDGPQLLIDAGVTCIVHPGGSKRDEDTFDLCASRGVTCLTTGLRHFRH